MASVPTKNTKKSTNTEKDTEKDVIEIKPAGETSRQYKTQVIAELIKQGKARMTRSCDFSK